MLNTSPIQCLPLQRPVPCSYMPEGRPQSLQTARWSYWVTDASLRLSLKQSKRKKSGSYRIGFLVTDSQLWALASGAQFLRQDHTVFPAPPAENKSHHSISFKKKKYTIIFTVYMPFLILCICYYLWTQSFNQCMCVSTVFGGQISLIC